MDSSPRLQWTRVHDCSGLESRLLCSDCLARLLRTVESIRWALIRIIIESRRGKVLSIWEHIFFDSISPIIIAYMDLREEIARCCNTVINVIEVKISQLGDTNRDSLTPDEMEGRCREVDQMVQWVNMLQQNIPSWI